MQQQTTYALANLADCGSPDEHDGIGFEPAAEPREGSAGARFLRSVEDDVRERIDYNDGNPLDHDDAHEIADGAVPIYTHQMWLTFVDLCAYNEDPSELGAEADDLNKAAGIALYMIADRLAHALIQEHAEEHDEDDA